MEVVGSGKGALDRFFRVGKIVRAMPAKTGVNALMMPTRLKYDSDFAHPTTLT